MVQFKDVAHFYLGCKLETPDGIACLVGIGLLGSEDQQLRTLKPGMSVTRGYNFSEVRPALRVWASMTEEEIAEYKKTKKVIQATPVHRIGVEVDTPQSFLYLTQKGFDIFKLIESGQAVDVREIPNQNQFI